MLHDIKRTAESAENCILLQTFAVTYTKSTNKVSLLVNRSSEIRRRYFTDHIVIQVERSVQCVWLYSGDNFWSNDI